MISDLTVEQKLQYVIFFIICSVAVVNYLIK